MREAALSDGGRFALSLLHVGEELAALASAQASTSADVPSRSEMCLPSEPIVAMNSSAANARLRGRRPGSSSRINLFSKMMPRAFCSCASGTSR
jgi:hypothetical protein